MVEPQQGGAVAHGTAEGNLAGSSQRPVEPEPVEPVAVRRHPARIADVAAKDESTDLARCGSSGEPAGTEAEIETGPDVGRLVDAAVPGSFPPGVSFERLDSSVHGDVIEPEFPRGVRAFQDGDHSEPVECGTVFPVA